MTNLGGLKLAEGGRTGGELEMAEGGSRVAELEVRIYLVCLRAVRRSEQSYFKKSTKT